MARGTTLERLLTDFRAEARISQKPAHNIVARDAQVVLLQRKQEWLWNEHDWPHLRVDRYIDLAAGQRYYDMPDDIDIDRIQRVAVRHDSIYYGLGASIEEQHYAAYDSDLDARSWPVQRWKITENTQIEVWPIPSENYDSDTLNGRLKITAIRRLNPLVNVADTADLDDRLIVLHAAAEHLASTGAKDAQLKLEQAEKLFVKLKGALQARRVVSRMLVSSVRGPDRENVERVPLAVYRTT